MSRTAPGTSVPIVIMRGGQQRTINATIGGAPNAEETAQAQAPKPQGRMGLQVSDMTPDIAKRMNLPSGAAGVVVTSVAAGSPAMEAGFQPGDVLLKINGKDVTSASQVSDQIKGLQAGTEATFVVRRDTMRMLLRSAVP